MISLPVCSCCEPRSAPRSAGRRHALTLLAGGLACGASGVLRAAGVDATTIVPKPENVLAPDQALERLMKGNERYVSGKINKKDFIPARNAVAKGQNPYVCILTCADSRVGPELCFDESLGDLFVTRIAGNYVTGDILASLEYGTAMLGASLIMVLGHDNCGAVGAAVKAYEQEVEFPGHIQTVASAIAPAVQAAANQPGGDTSLVERATIENVRINVANLQRATPILTRRVRQGNLRVVGGIYSLETGRVAII